MNSSVEDCSHRRFIVVDLWSNVWSVYANTDWAGDELGWQVVQIGSLVV